MQSHIFQKIQVKDFSYTNIKIIIRDRFKYFCAFSLIGLSLVAMPVLANAKTTLVPQPNLLPKPKLTKSKSASVWVMPT